ncbi:unnamed protein product [Schistosoma curassoni]|uniref:Uncharacterized protein n=1 Tax=Schistosoma curassoni TaxID=6186 RepID=A0A183JQK2_9TREM|nr:unnamed protein product [Schistosoma curassoni]
MQIENGRLKNICELNFTTSAQFRVVVQVTYLLFV